MNPYKLCEGCRDDGTGNRCREGAACVDLDDAYNRGKADGHAMAWCAVRHQLRNDEPLDDADARKALAQRDAQAFDAKLNGLDRNAIRLAATGEKQEAVPASVRCFATELRDLLLDPDEVDEMHRAAAARALLEAADALEQQVRVTTTAGTWARADAAGYCDWLRARADAIERGDWKRNA